MQKTEYINWDENDTSGNIKYFKDLSQILETEINSIEEGPYKENLKLLIEIINNKKTRVSYIHIKSLFIVYNLLDSIKKLQNSNEVIINELVNNLSHTFLMGEISPDTQLENIILDHSIKNQEYTIEKKNIRIYKNLVAQILKSLLIKEENTSLIGPLFDSKMFLEKIIDKYSNDLIQILENNNISIKK